MVFFLFAEIQGNCLNIAVNHKIHKYDLFKECALWSWISVFYFAVILITTAGGSQCVI